MAILPTSARNAEVFLAEPAISALLIGVALGAFILLADFAPLTVGIGVAITGFAFSFEADFSRSALTVYGTGFTAVIATDLTAAAVRVVPTLSGDAELIQAEGSLGTFAVVSASSAVVLFADFALFAVGIAQASLAGVGFGIADEG